MKKKALLVLLMAVQITSIYAGSVQNKQAAMLAKQKEEFIKGVRGIRHLLKKDTITDEEKAALKSLAKKGSLLIVALAGIAVTGYLGKKYLGSKIDSGPSTVTLCGEDFEIELPEKVNDGWELENEKDGCFSYVKIQKNAQDPPFFSVTVRTNVTNSLQTTGTIFNDVKAAIKKAYPQQGIILFQLFDFSRVIRGGTDRWG